MEEQPAQDIDAGACFGKYSISLKCRSGAKTPCAFENLSNASLLWALPIV
jgi:rubredoxin